MTDPTLTPEVYGDFGLPLEQVQALVTTHAMFSQCSQAAQYLIEAHAHQTAGNDYMHGFYLGLAHKELTRLMPKLQAAVERT